MFIRAYIRRRDATSSAETGNGPEMKLRRHFRWTPRAAPCLNARYFASLQTGFHVGQPWWILTANVASIAVAFGFLFGDNFMFISTVNLVE